MTVFWKLEPENCLMDELARLTKPYLCHPYPGTHPYPVVKSNAAGFCWCDIPMRHFAQ